jgi:hypothetical protein
MKQKEEGNAYESPEKEEIPKVVEEKPKYYQSQMAPKNIWIIKPGENTNRG